MSYLDRVSDLRNDPFFPTSLPVAMFLALMNARDYAEQTPPRPFTPSPDEHLRIAAALLATSRSGGGSADYFLFCNYRDAHGVDDNSDEFWAQVMRLTNQVVNEAVEYGIVTRVEGAR